MYTGKQDSGTEFGLGEKVVLNLATPLEGSNAHLTFDNFFTSIKLLEKLYDKNLYATGTVRTNRTGLPDICKANKVSMNRNG